MPKTTYLANKVAEHVTGKTTFTKPTNTYLGLLTANPTLAGSQASELSGGGYARQQITWDTAADGIIANSADIHIPLTTSVPFAYFGVFDAATSGNMLYFFSLGGTVNSILNEDVIVAAGELKLREM